MNNFGSACQTVVSAHSDDCCKRRNPASPSEGKRAVQRGRACFPSRPPRTDVRKANMKEIMFSIGLSVSAVAIAFCILAATTWDKLRGMSPEDDGPDDDAGK
jgi:hypothetical protein